VTANIPPTVGGQSEQQTGDDPAAEAAWQILLSAARAAGRPDRDESGPLDGVLAWRPRTGWEPLLADDDPRLALIELYLPICSATPSRPITVGHLGQSLDGFIATHAGESQWVTGRANIRHLHRMRALCDAVVVGAGTIAADDPLLTTRQVPGPSPLRVVIDPTRRLLDHYRVFTDASTETLYVCTRSLIRPGETSFGTAQLLGVDGDAEQIDVSLLQRLLRARGCHRIFVEGGGITVSAFLAANLLDRLHVAIAPLIIGEGRPAIRLPAPTTLSDCQRPRHRVFRMGGDVLFDCDLRTTADEPAKADGSDGISRVI
jgi:riboflavin-specific deaminase-like protein